MFFHRPLFPARILLAKIQLSNKELLEDTPLSWVHPETPKTEYHWRCIDLKSQGEYFVAP
jgi:hypothetical protein